MVQKEIITSLSDCPEPTTPELVPVIRRRDSVTEIFAECGKRLGYQARQVVQLTRKRSQLLLCRPSSILEKNKLKTKPKCGQGFWKRFSLDKWATVILVLMILLILIVGLLLVRSYNRAHAYGTGGCLWPTFWGQCQIMT
ncbi:uncharacterized protein LOC110176232 [Drosophila serrata]|uniref:uncharacterized protein LOC110176232 n=1 Tax=Drosophila serrata TaxID=7274 RepID=UPI000A1D1A08|nr:uncharacterized protein LOC110176232 [Drosophila serrata]